MLGGTQRREGRRREERTTVRKHRKGHGPCKPVNEMALDSRTGEEEEILDQRVTDGVASGQDHPPLHCPQRTSLVRNRMREICASGSVGGEGGNALAYPAISCRQRRSSATVEDDPQRKWTRTSAIRLFRFSPQSLPPIRAFPGSNSRKTINGNL
jgi:hypothetical protein